jgi:hypothetical protein
VNFGCDRPLLAEFGRSLTAVVDPEQAEIWAEDNRVILLYVCELQQRKRTLSQSRCQFLD